MEPPLDPVPSPVSTDAGPSLSPVQRAIAIFTKPGSAWGGLTARGQWWFPLLVILLVAAGFTAALHQRAMMPMIMESWDEAVSEGKMTAEQVDKMADFMGGPAGMAITIVQQVIAWPLILLVTALIVWFGVGFVLGTRFKFRLAFETVAWASLILIPGQLLTGVLAWSKQTMKGLHTGFGILLPEADPPSKLIAGLGFFLDAIGPLSIWYLAVLIIGAAALSGAKRKSVAWTVGGLYVALMACFAAIVAMMTKGG